MLFELAGVPEATAREAFRLASYKLPIKTQVVSRAAEAAVSEAAAQE
jgi:large subunit ribosomal protein L16